MSIELNEIPFTYYGKQYWIYASVAEDNLQEIDFIRLVRVGTHKEEWCGSKSQIKNEKQRLAFEAAEAIIAENCDNRTYIEVTDDTNESAMLIDYFDTGEQ